MEYLEGLHLGGLFYSAGVRLCLLDPPSKAHEKVLIPLKRILAVLYRHRVEKFVPLRTPHEVGDFANGRS